MKLSKTYLRQCLLGGTEKDHRNLNQIGRYPENPNYDPVLPTATTTFDSNCRWHN